MLISIAVITSCTKDETVLTGSIIGKVTDASNSEPIKGATISVFPGGLSKTTGSDGYFEFINLDAIQYEIQASKNNYITNNKIVNVVAGNNSVGDIQLTPVKSDAKLELSVNTLNFGKTNNSMSFDIINNGNAVFSWNISGIDGIDWFKISPLNGTIEPEKKYAVKVDLIRDNILQNKEAIVIITADKESVALKITAEK